MILDETFRGKTVLLTGHTGFKGSWLASWLLRIGAHVVGVSKDIPTTPSLFDILRLEDALAHHLADIRDLQRLREIFQSVRPDFLIHLAAQAIVSRSYGEPAETMTTNIIGTTNVLETLRQAAHPCVAVLITSDKCYDNAEWVWGYRETDRLGGPDPYSGSKAGAEMVIRSYVASFFGPGSAVRIGVARAGNVIGGGDWASDRIVVDCVRAWSSGRAVEIRNPAATRPWQHVLEPLSGYLALGAALARGEVPNGEAFNFGPRAEQNRTVRELIADLAAGWVDVASPSAVTIAANGAFGEAGLLKLNCDKALHRLRWAPTLDYDETMRFVRDWYRQYYTRVADMTALTNAQIEAYEGLASERGRAWA